MEKLEIITLDKENIADFAKERNELLKKSKAEWVFFLDSDERISADLRKEVESAITRNNFDGYYIQRKNYLVGQYVGTDKIIRLGKRNAGKWVRAVHETWEIEGQVGTLKNPIIHNTGNSLNEFIQKIDKYSTLHAEENFKEGKKSNIFKIVLFPTAKFLQSLLIGRGVVMSIMQALHSFLSWTKLYFLYS